MSKEANFRKDYLFDVSNLVVVVTGASSGSRPFPLHEWAIRPLIAVCKGIGLLMAKALEANGATVYITGRRKDRLESVAKEAVSSLQQLQYAMTIKEEINLFQRSG